MKNCIILHTPFLPPLPPVCAYSFPCYFLPSWDFYFNILLHLLNSLYYSSPLCIFIRIYIFSKQTKLEVEAEFDFDSLSVLGRKIIKNYLIPGNCNCMLKRNYVCLHKHFPVYTHDMIWLLGGFLNQMVVANGHIFWNSYFACCLSKENMYDSD